MTINNSSIDYDDNYAEEHVESPISSAILDTPLYESERIADDALGGAGMGGILSLGGGLITKHGVLGASGGLATGILTGGIVSAVAGILTERNAKTKEGRAIGRGLGWAGGFGTIVGGVKLASLAFWPSLLAIFGGTFAYSILYYILSGKYGKAKKIVEDKVGKDKAVEVLAKIENGIKETKEKITQNGDKTTIRV